jgi:hypothetical protein
MFLPRTAPRRPAWRISRAVDAVLAGLDLVDAPAQPGIAHRPGAP